jgi:predicted Ser/Thr protein kinase
VAGALTKAGRYQIVSELGRGSMGVVYQGFDPVIGRTVAIKTMLLEGLSPAEFEEYKTRFQREAQAAGVLTHPNIVTVYDFGEDNGVLYLAMELLEGKSLQGLVEEQTILPVETIIPMYEQVCSALDHAHARRIVHRDIKPANIMILESGQVKVTDFGIAKMMSMGMTQAGQILGTPNYMSPEQVKGRPVDGRSDIFSLGVILYELVTGEKPFGGQNITTVIYKIINENPIPPRELDATISPGLSYVIQKALAKNPDERYQTCRELSDDLKNYRNLGWATAPSATVVVRVPPIQAAAAEAAAPPAVKPSRAQPPPAQQAAPRPMSVQVIPPQAARARGTPVKLWLLLVLFLVVGLGGGYFLFHYQQSRETAETQTPVSPPPAPSTQTTPAPQEAVPAGGETTAPEGAGTEAVAPEATKPPEGTATLPEKVVPEPQPAASEPAKRESVPAAPPARAAKPAAVPKFGQLVVTSNIAGAAISIDGKTNPGWVTPHTFPDLSSGTHTVVVSKPGYSESRQSVTIEGGRTRALTASLAVPSGEINILTVPADIEVLIDGQPAGRTPVRRIIGIGEHTYSLRPAGLPPYNSSFEIKYDGHMVTKKVDLGGEVAAPTGIVEVRTIPPGATVFADGKPVGGTTPTNFRLAAGRHTLTISLSGFRPTRKEIDVPADGSTAVNETLSRQ